MSVSHGHRAAELLRECARDAECNNGTLLERLTNETRRLGGALAEFFEEDGSSEQREMLPTPQTLTSALDLRLLSCKCRLCVPPGDDGSRSKDVVFKENRVNDYATLILCGCLFLVRNPTFNRSANLDAFVVTCSGSRRKEDLELFGGLATVPTHCCVPHIDGCVKWKKWKHLRDVCNSCRWKAFKDAHQLKRTILAVAAIPGEFDPPFSDLTNHNVPFINLKRPNIKSGRANVKFYISQIHRNYNTFEPNELQTKELFRKVYAYQHKVESEKTKISEAKEEARIAYHMSQKHGSVAKLLYAFCRSGFDYEIVELVFKKYDNNLENLLLGHQGLIPHAGDRSEPIDNVLWKEMLNLVEAVVELHSFHPSPNPLDLKPANILVEQNDQGRLALYLTDFGHVVETKPRRATVDYAPPGEDESCESENETGITYDVWSMACILLQVLVFIQGRSELELFNSSREAGFSDAAYWCKKGEEFTLRGAVSEQLTSIETQYEHRTRLASLQIRQMLNVEPGRRGNMGSCLSTFKTAMNVSRPEDQNVMMCGCERWSVFHRNLTNTREVPAHLAVYRDPPEAGTYVNPSQRQRPESISINLDGDYTTRGECHEILISPAAFFSSENNGEKKAVRFKSLLSDHTLLFSNTGEYRHFIALITRHEIICKDSPPYGTDFVVVKCSIKKSNESFTSGRLQVWKRLPERDYDKRFKRYPLPRPNSYIPENEKKLTDFILVLWARYESTQSKVCLIIDIGESTWKLDHGKNVSPRLLIQPKRKLETFYQSQLRATIYQEEADVKRTSDKYPFIPIEPAELYKRLKKGVVEDLDIQFSSPTETRDFINILKRYKFFDNLP